MSMSDRVAVMREGKFEQVAPPEEIFQQPRTRFTADFMGASNILSGTIDELDARGEEARRSQCLAIRLDSGIRIISQEREGVGAGDSVWFSIRPEDIYLRPSGDALDTDNRFEGTIAEKVYLGDVTEFDVDLEADVGLVCRIESRRAQRFGLKKGDAVLVGWDAEDCNLLDD